MGNDGLACFLATGLGLQIDAELADGRAGCGFGDAQANLFGGNGMPAPEAACTDAGAFCEFLPGTLLPSVERPVVDALAKLDLLAQVDDTEGDRFAEVQSDLRGQDLVIAGPVNAVVLTVDDIGGLVGFALSADIACRNRGGCGKVGRENRANAVAKALEGGHVMGRQLSFRRWRDPDIHGGISADRPEIDRNQFRRGGRFRSGVVIPTLGMELQWEIALGGAPIRSIAKTLVENLSVGVPRPMLGIINGRPAEFADGAVFVAVPSQIRTGVAEDAGSRLKFPDDLEGVGPIVIAAVVDRPAFIGAAVVTSPAVGSVNPELEDWAIVR